MDHALKRYLRPEENGPFMHGFCFAGSAADPQEHGGTGSGVDRGMGVVVLGSHLQRVTASPRTRHRQRSALRFAEWRMRGDAA